MDAFPFFRLHPLHPCALRRFRVLLAWLFRDQVTRPSMSTPRLSTFYTEHNISGLAGRRRTLLRISHRRACRMRRGRLPSAWRRTQRTILLIFRLGDGRAHRQYNLAMCPVEPPWGRLGAVRAHRSWGGSWNPALSVHPSPSHLEMLAASADILVP